MIQVSGVQEVPLPLQEAWGIQEPQQEFLSQEEGVLTQEILGDQENSGDLMTSH